MTHAEIVAAIEARGGRLVASFVLDEYGRTEGEPLDRRPHHCSACGRPGHTLARCTGPDSEPRPTHAERRSKADRATFTRWDEQTAGDDWLREATRQPQPLDETKRILRERADARTAARRRGTPRK